jgi:hypothetical protein
VAGGEWRALWSPKRWRVLSVLGAFAAPHPHCKTTTTWFGDCAQHWVDALGLQAREPCSPNGRDWEERGQPHLAQAISRLVGCSNHLSLERQDLPQLATCESSYLLSPSCTDFGAVDCKGTLQVLVEPLRHWW